MRRQNLPIILVIEDEPSVANLVGDSLSRQNFHSVVKNDGAEGIVAYQECEPDAILLDVWMPGLSGFDVCRIIREQHLDTTTPIIMLTGAEDAESIDRAFELGATDFLIKPINLPLLIQRLRYALWNQRNEESLKESIFFQNRVVDLAQVGYWGFNYSDLTFVLNKSSKALLHLSDREYSTEELLALIHPEDRGQMETALAERREMYFEIRMNLPSIGERIFRVNCNMDDSQDALMHGAFQDITNQRNTENLLGYLRHYDELTGLMNESSLLQHIENQQLVYDTDKLPPILTKISLARLDALVQVFGQQRVNKLISQLGSELKSRLRSFRSQTKLYYIEDGQFVILWTSQTGEQVSVLLMALVQLLEQERYLDQELLTPSAVASAMVLENVDHTTVDVCRGARWFLFQLPEELGDRVVWYEEIDPIDTRQQLDLEVEVKRALQANQFDLYLQPQLTIRGGNRVWGFEALVRWVDSDGHLMTHGPDEFLPAIERQGLSVQLGNLVIEKAFAKGKMLQDAGLDMRLGINLAAQQFSDHDLVPFILTTLANTGMRASQFEFEITESTAMDDPQLTVRKLKTLREAGFHLAVDDFGTGFSAMEYLLKFPLTTLKIDRSFIDEVTHNEEMQAIVRGVVAMAKGLGLLTIAEGVETADQRDYLDATGVDVLQGFYFARPMPIDDAIAFAKSVAPVVESGGGDVDVF